KDETRALQQLARMENMKVSEFLLSITIATLACWSGHKTCSIALAGHGREALFDDVDLSRTVGWFQIYYPMHFQLPSEFAMREIPRTLREQITRIPSNGIGYGLLKYLCADAHVRGQLHEQLEPQVSFNYMGEHGFEDTPQGNSLFTVSQASYGPAQD